MLDAQTSFIISQVLGVITTILAMIELQLTQVKTMLVFEILLNSIDAATYILLGSFSGFWVVLLAIPHSTINMLYQRKGKKPELWIGILFCIGYLCCSLLNFNRWVDVFPALAALCFAGAIQQTKASYFRLFRVFNFILWIVFDVITKAYTTMICFILLLIIVIIAIVRNHDFSRKTKEAPSQENNVS